MAGAGCSEDVPSVIYPIVGKPGGGQGSHQIAHPLGGRKPERGKVLDEGGVLRFCVSGMSRDENIDKARDETIAELKAALGELEGGAELSRFTGGHGLMSRVFAFEWHEPALSIDFRLPYALVLAEEEEQKDADAEIGAAIRMALLLLSVWGDGAWDGEGTVTSVWADGNGVGYSVRDGEGNTVDAGDDWSGLLRRLESALPEGEEPLDIIWP